MFKCVHKRVCVCVCVYVLKTLQLFSVLDLWSYIPLAVTEQCCSFSYKWIAEI